MYYPWINRFNSLGFEDLDNASSIVTRPFLNNSASEDSRVCIPAPELV